MSTLANSTIEGKVFDTTGPIFAQRNGEQIELKINDPIYETDVIITGEDTTADILYRDGTKSRVAPNTKFTLTDYEFGAGDDAPSFVMDLTQGAVRTVTGEIVKLNPEAFEVITPRATVGIRGTEFLNTVDPTTESETHAVLFISNGSIMLVQGKDGSSVSLSDPLQVTQFTQNSASPTDLQSVTLEQMNSVISVLAPTLGADIPQSPEQQGQWQSVQTVTTEVEKQKEEENQENNDDNNSESDNAQQNADNAQKDAIENAPENLEQGQAPTIIIVASEDEDLEDILESLEEIGINVVVVTPENANNNLNQLQANANNAIVKPELAGNTEQGPTEISFTRYLGGNLTDSDGLQYTSSDMANATQDFLIQGFEIYNSTSSEPIGVGGSFPSSAPTENEPYTNLNTGSGNDRIVLGATYNNGSYTNVAYDYTKYQQISGSVFVYANVVNTNVNTGAGDDTIYIRTEHNNYDDFYNPPLVSSYNATFNLGDGNDTMDVGAIVGTTINAGSGNDTIKLAALIEESSTILAGSGDDVISITSINIGGGSASINTEDGNDRLDITSISSRTEIDMGSGNDTIIVANSGTKFTTINTGDGNDFANLNVFTSSIVNLGDGNDILILQANGDPIAGEIQGGEGKDLLISISDNSDAYDDNGFEAFLHYNDTSASPEFMKSFTKESLASELGVTFLDNGDIQLDDSKWSFADDAYQYESNPDIRLYTDGITVALV